MFWVIQSPHPAHGNDTNHEFNQDWYGLPACLLQGALQRLTPLLTAPSRTCLGATLAHPMARLLELFLLGFARLSSAWYCCSITSDRRIRANRNPFCLPLFAFMHKRLERRNDGRGPSSARSLWWLMIYYDLLVLSVHLWIIMILWFMFIFGSNNNNNK